MDSSFYGDSRWADGGAEKKLAFSTKTASGKFTFANDDSPHGERRICGYIKKHSA
jgi:hypothetical protein